MSHDPAAVDLGSAGRGNVAHDQGLMRRDAATQGTQDAATVFSTKASNGEIELSETQEVQEQSTLSLLGQHASPGPGPSQDDAVAIRGPAAGGIAPAHDSTPIRDGEVNGTIEGARAEPSTASAAISAQLGRTAPIPIPSPQKAKQKARDSLLSEAASPLDIKSAPTGIAPQLHESKPLANGTNPHGGKMVLGTSSASSSHRRRVMANTSALTRYEADLTDRDRAKQKEAVRRYLTERVKTDWEWEWPRPEEGAPISRPASPSPDFSNDTTGNAYDMPGEYWKERDEWLSNTSEGEGAIPSADAGGRHDPPVAREDPFCFGSPESVGSYIRRHETERKRRRKRRLAEEMAYNDGMRCFVQRRDAWTGARHVIHSPDNGLTRPRTKRGSIYSLLPGKSPAADVEPESDAGLVRTRTKRSSLYSILPGRASVPAETTDTERETDPEVDRATQIPVAAPILPPLNAMRASITPAAYNTIYDKVVLQGQTPSCPMNLKDVTRSCVQGWKRDGEWPPKSTELPKKKGRRLSLVSLFGQEKNDENEGERVKEKKSESTPEGNEKGPKRPAATIGKGIRKIMFWKEKHESQSSGGTQEGKEGNGQEMTTSPAKGEA